VLGGGALKLGLGVLAIGDVRENTAPVGLAVVTGEYQGVVAQPHDMAVAVQHPVLGRALAMVSRLLAGDHPVTVVGMQLATPERRIAAPLLRGEAQDRLDLGTDVGPTALGARFGGVEDRGHPLRDPRVLGWLEGTA
jgi:hypothetical protein